MSNYQDVSVGFGTESTFRTYVAPTRTVEPVSESLDWKKTIKQGKGLRVAGRVPRAARRVYTAGMGSGDIELEYASKGLGLVLQGLTGGTATPTLVSAATYQTLFTLGDTMPSFTIQKGIPNTGGTIDPYSYLGCVASGFDLELAQSGLLMLKTSWDLADLTTAQALAAVAYPTGPVNLFGFQNSTLSLGGTLTMPTSTALASASSPSAVSVRAFSLSVDHNLATDRFLIGNSGRKSKATVGLRDGIKGKITIEYDQTTTRDLFLNDTATSLLFGVTAGALGTGSETIQVVLPSVYLEGDTPNGNGGDLITQDLEFTLTDDLSRTPLTIVTRSADTAL